MLRCGGPSYVVSGSLMLFSYQVLWLSFGSIPIITAIPGSDGKADTADDGTTASALVLPYFFPGRPALGNIRREIYFRHDEHRTLYVLPACLQQLTKSDE